MKSTVAFCCLLLVGCGGSEDTTTVADTGVVTADTASSDTTSALTDTAAPATDGATSTDGATEDVATTMDTKPDVPAGPCNDLADMSMGVLPTFMGGAAPMSSGGTIEDGTFVLSMVTQYNGSASTTKDYGTIRFTAGVMDRTEGSKKSRATYEVSTRFLKLTYSCGGLSTTETLGFTASPGVFREYVSYGGGTRVRTYYKK